MFSIKKLITKCTVVALQLLILIDINNVNCWNDEIFEINEVTDALEYVMKYRRINQSTYRVSGHIIVNQFANDDFIVDVEEKFENIDFHSSQSEILIRGIPEKDDENLLHLYENLATVLKFPYEMAYVLSTIFRLKNTNDPHPVPILLKFSTPFLKQLFFNQYLKFQHLKLSDIGYHSSDRIYFCDNLTNKNLALFRKAAEMKKENKIEKIQVRNGFIHVMFIGSTEFKRITCEDDLLGDIRYSQSTIHIE